MSGKKYQSTWWSTIDMWQRASDMQNLYLHGGRWEIPRIAPPLRALLQVPDSENPKPRYWGNTRSNRQDVQISCVKKKLTGHWAEGPAMYDPAPARESWSLRNIAQSRIRKIISKCAGRFAAFQNESKVRWRHSVGRLEPWNISYFYQKKEPAHGEAEMLIWGIRDRAPASIASSTDAGEDIRCLELPFSPNCTKWAKERTQWPLH